MLKKLLFFDTFEGYVDGIDMSIKYVEILGLFRHI